MAIHHPLIILSNAEVDARKEVMYENYNTVCRIEADTLLTMIETGIIPACAADLATYQVHSLAEILKS